MYLKFDFVLIFFKKKDKKNFGKNNKIWKIITVWNKIFNANAFVNVAKIFKNK